VQSANKSKFTYYRPSLCSVNADGIKQMVTDSQNRNRQIKRVDYLKYIRAFNMTPKEYKDFIYLGNRFKKHS